MNNWKAFYDLEKKKESDKRELNKKRLLFLGVQFIINCNFFGSSSCF